MKNVEGDRGEGREAAPGLEILVEPLRGARLVRDYLAGEGSAPSFYSGGSPFELASFRAKLDEVRGRFGRAERERAAAALRPTSPGAAERLARFVEEGGAMVTTGQQTGLFTGPLYTVHKILTAVRLAEALERELGVLVLPVFWAASEDHDWGEVDHADVLDARGEVRRIRIPGDDSVPLPMSERRVGTGIEASLAELADALAGEPLAEDCLRLLREAYSPDATIAGAFRETVAKLFAGFDLLITDAAAPALKRASAPVLEGAILRTREHEALLRARTAELEAAGYHGQVAVLPEGANVFHHGPAGRERLYARGDGWYTRGARRHFTAEEVREAVAADPTRFSPNVFLRPVVESAVFPTLAYVGGPGEMAYFAQLGRLFREFGMGMPVVYPRFSVTLVSPGARRTMERLGIGMADLDAPEHELVRRLARERVPAGVEEALQRLREGIAEGYAGLIEAAEAVDPTLRGALGSLRNRSLLEAADAERKVVSAVARAGKGVARDVRRVRAELRPHGEPQDRVLNVSSFLAGHGPALLAQIAERMVVPLGAEMPERAPVEAPIGEGV
ncbi:MAG TPA: bacillithiol biosynthesis cysteine-adding enzyme BshC [Longimicrobiaceae bacterium]|nr:bacillithiol biosynthesis cysteine-adding enzyme BshC [Longimicrobiaceae bacterium]